MANPLKLKVIKGSADVIGRLNEVLDKAKAGEVTSVLIIYDGPDYTGRRKHLRSLKAIPYLNMELDALKGDMINQFEEDSNPFP